MYYIYKITNLINNKIYIGVHKSNNIKNDDYMGSGKILQIAIQKYGINKFKREILFKYNNKKDAYEREAEIVNEVFIARWDTYNIKLGGEGGFEYINKNRKYLWNSSTPGYKEAMLLAAKKTNNWWKELRKNNPKKYYNLKHLSHRPETRKKISNKLKLYYENNNGTFLNRHHSEKTKEKMRKSAKGKHKGKLNSQWGTCWIYNESLKKSKKIKKEELQNWLNKGWIKGRKIKF